MAEATARITPRRSRQNRFGEIGNTGLNAQTGVLYEEFRRELVGLPGIKIYEEMSRNDPIIGFILFVIEQSIQQVEWKVIPFSEEKKDEDSRLFIEQCLDDMSQSWPETLSEICSMFVFGWALTETCYKMRKGTNPPNGMPKSKHNDNKIGWRKWAIRGQNTLIRWEFDESGGIAGMTQTISPTVYEEVTIPIAKALLWRTKIDKNNPEGLSILRHAYVPWWYGKRLKEFEAIGHERDAAGLAVLTPPEGVDIWNENDPDMSMALSAASKLVTRIRRGENEGVVKPFGWTLELLSSSSRRQSDLNTTIIRYDTRIAQSVAADWVMLGHGQTGSRALSVDKTDMSVLCLSAYLKRIEEVVNRFAIPSLLELNSMDSTRPPSLSHGDIETKDLSQLGTYLKTLTDIGAINFPDDALEEYVRTAGDLPPAPDEPAIPEDWAYTVRQPVTEEPVQPNEPAVPSNADAEQPEE